MALEKDLNIPPYFDDYDEDKNFHKILYRPSTAVQARELTQSQTILQNQIERFGNHIFKDGSIVEGVGITYYPSVNYISLENSINYANGVESIIAPTDLDSSYLITNSTDSNNAVRAVIKIAKNGIKANAPNTNRFYLSYITTGKDGADNDVNQFSPGDILYIYNSNQNKFNILDSNNLVYTVNTLSTNSTFTSNGTAYCVSVTDGTIFQKGFFSKVHSQTIAVNEFSTNVSNYVVGFSTNEEIITENEDSTLNDNALGYSNENAPGAHRLKLIPTLISKLKSNTSIKNFFSIIEFDNNLPVQQKDGSEYNAVGDHIAKRTYEESGDYVTIPFNVEPRTNSSNSQSFFYEVSPGIGYVRGQRIEKISITKLEVSKATTTDFSQNEIVTANYGNYIICNEFLGVFDTEQISEITFYDQPQRAISEYEGTTAALSGSSVGKANVRAIVFEQGTKGLPETKYLIYLFNIRMNSGKTFSTDVKSVYMTGSFGNAKADIVLENDLAILKESAKNSLVFDTGIQAIKRLTNNTGIGDTNYTYNQIKSSTITSGGLVTVTIDTAAPGTSTERLNYSVGSLSSASMEPFNVYLSQNAYSANLTGTLNISSGNVVITGSSTTFLTQLNANSNIRIHANTTQTYVRRVVSISNNTSLTLDSPLSFTNATCNFQKYYVTGTPLPLSSITINSNTSFTANLNMTLASGTQTVYCSYPVNRNQATSIPKIINKNRWVKIDCSNNVSNTVGPWNLGLPDVHKIRNVYIGTTYDTNNPVRTTWFTLDDGQKDDIYDHSRLFVKPEYASQVTNTTKLLVELDHFIANTSSSVGFFSVESYPIDDVNTSNTNAIQTIEIPQYKSLELRNTIDFRPYKVNTAISTTTIASSTINPAINSSSFSVASYGQYTIIPDTNFEADFEYYLPRYDLIGLNSIGNFVVNRGTPSTSPRRPFVENDQSEVAECYVPPYPSATPREYEIYKNVPYIKSVIKTNRRYTMKDIGVLENRIQRLEYYTVLNTLEQQAKDLTIPDANGLDRFKNGIFADPFNSHNLGNVSDFEYKIAIDSDKTLARPYFQRHDVDLIFIPNTSTETVKSSNIKQTGPLITLDYNDEVFITQNIATKYRVITEASWQWNGRLALYPSYDFFRDESIVPTLNVNIDLSSAWEQFANSPWGSRWGDWRTVSSVSTSNTVTTRVSGGTQLDTTTVTNTTQQATVESIKVNTLTQNIDLGSYVKDISISPYMRSRLIAFVSTNMKPRTRLHAFFDDVNVDAHCAQGILSGITNPEEGKEDQVVTQTTDFGTQLVSDENGFICGIFRIPAQTFRTGDRVFMLANVIDLTTGSDARISLGTAVYTADNLSVTKSSTTLAVRQPQIAVLSTTQQRLLTNTTTRSEFIPDIIADGGGDGGSSGDGGGGADGGGGGDPMAQSFTISNIPDTVTGIFLTKVGLYFRSKDNTLGCSVLICEMENNMPDQSRIIGQAHLPSSSILTSRGPSLGEPLVETIFTLDFPVYLLSNKDYAFITIPDGNSPNYSFWICETGDFDVTTDRQAFSNPYSGMLFISANRKTWTAIQKEDITFNLYRARFSQSTGNAIFRNENDEYLLVDGFNKVSNSMSISLGDFAYVVNASANLANVSSIVSNTLSNVSGRVQYINEANGEIVLDFSLANSSIYFSNTTNPTIAIYRTLQRSNVATLTTNTLVSYANVVLVDNPKYHAVVPKFGSLQPSRTNLDYNFKGTSNSNVFDTTYTNVVNEIEYEFTDYERNVLSKSNEVQISNSFKSTYFDISFTSFSDFVSPVINLSRKTPLFLENLINNDVTNEHTRYGNTLSKYISKKVVLADGQEAEDIKVYITAHRPSETDIKVYVKLRNTEDTQAFEDKVWTLLSYNNDGDTIYTSPIDKTDFREYEFYVPSINSVPYAAFANNNTSIATPLTGTISIANNSYTITGTGSLFTTELSVGKRIRIVSNDYIAIRTVVNISNNTSLVVDQGLEQANTSSLFYVFNDGGNDGIVEYYNTDNSRFVGFKEFAVKIDLLSSNPIKVPLLNDVRVIALQI